MSFTSLYQAWQGGRVTSASSKIVKTLKKKKLWGNFGPTHPHSAVHAAVSLGSVLPAVSSVEQPPVAVVTKVALVRPPLISINYYFYWSVHL